MTSVLDRPAPGPDATVRYGELREHVIDLRVPAKVPAPLIVLIHGGFWRPAYDRTHLRPMADALAADGWVVAMPEYRRAGMAPDWRGTFDDIAAAMDRVTGLAVPYGADPDRVTWAGHSAGGHLVLWAAQRPGFPDGSAWYGQCDAKHVVPLAACSSLRLCAELKLSRSAVQNLLGGEPDEVPGRYAVTDPAALPPPRVPVTLVHGTADDDVPVEVSRAFGIGTLAEIPGAGHFDLIDPESGAWTTVLDVFRSGRSSGIAGASGTP